MTGCDVYGNEDDKALTVMHDGNSMTFDGFACATHAMAPRCIRCGYTIVGHDVEAGGSAYRCDRCADHRDGLCDRA